MDQIIDYSFDLTEEVLYIPIRHHSPACSYHLKKVIHEYEPEIILIEGAVNTNHLMPHLSDKRNVPPFAIYYSFNDRTGLLGESGQKFSCYYPFLDYSPELLAIREAGDKGVPVQFIDLPYVDMLLASEKGAGLRDESDKHDYSSDVMVDYSSYVAELCKREGCSDSEELWEKQFELHGLNQDSHEFFTNLYTYCYFSREATEEITMQRDGTFAREAFMNKQIEEAREKFNKILVITGGFHTPALLHRRKQKVPRLRKIKPEDAGVYLMSYSFDACSRLRGYASGMKYPNFYQSVWRHIAEPETCYHNSVLEYILSCRKKLTKEDYPLSISDEIEATRMCEGLSALRGKPSSGVYELKDAILSSFVKGERDLNEELALHTLEKNLVGNRMGTLGSNSEQPPLVLDFQKQCKKFKLKQDTEKNESTISIYKSEQQRLKSCFFHQLKFLTESFCTLAKGPDYANKTESNLIREIWNYRLSPEVTTELIERSQYGGTLVEASGELIAEQYRKSGHSHAGTASKLITEASIMGLAENANHMLESLYKTIIGDGIFHSVTECAINLDYLIEAAQLLRLSNKMSLEEITIHAVSRAITLIPSLASISEDDEDEIINSLKSISFLVMRLREKENMEVQLKDSLLALLEFDTLNSAIEGAVVGMLSGIGELSREEAAIRARGYLTGSGNSAALSAKFLKGLFATAKDALLCNDELTIAIDKMIQEIPEEEFMAIVPNMRIAFSHFSPTEINTIGKRVGSLYDTTGVQITQVKAVDLHLLATAREIEQLTIERLQKRRIYVR